jgi:hypothetical protein
MAKDPAYLPPETVELFLRKLVTDKLATTTDEAGALLGGGHLTITRMRIKGATYGEAVLMTAVLKKLKPFSAESVNVDELAEIAATPTGRSLLKRVKKPRENSAERRTRVENEMRAQIEAELRKKYKLPPLETETA